MSLQFFLPCLALIACFSTIGRADVITTHRIVEADKPVSRSPETLTLASNDARLTQTWDGTFGSDGSASFRRTIQITQYAKNRIATLDVALKIYKFEPIGTVVPLSMMPPSIRLTRLADEKVLGYDTHHFFLDFLYVTSPFADGHPLLRQEIWILPAASNPKLPTQPHNLAGMESVKVTGDAQFWPEIQSGIFIKQSVFDSVPADETPTKIVYTEEISALSIGDIAPANFDIPGDYRELSPAQFAAALNKERRDALERKMEEIDRRADAT